MCGIAGYVQSSPAPPDPRIINAMMGCIAHRGPDGSGVWTTQRGDWSVSLAHRRLAIIDLEGGKQPMGNEDGSLQITYNGELYNHLALHDDLAAKGHTFRTRSDTEAIIHHIQEYGGATGGEGLAAFDGMFAFALWDQNRGRLLLARDRVGIKPLFYAALPDGGLAFASELTALMAHPAIGREIDPNGLASFLFLDYAHAPTSLFKGVHKLEQGCFVAWSDGKLEAPRRYWSMAEKTQSPPRDGTLVRRVREGLNEAVRSQLLADVPVGVFLSGGIDSSLVAALATRHHSGRLKTFTIRFDDPQFDESPFARIVADHIGSEHIEERLTQTSLLESVGAALDCLDEPLADPSIIPTFILSRLASRHVKVALGGDGGDELWGGYPTYKAHSMADRYASLPRAIRTGLIEPLVRRLPVRPGYQTFEWKAKRFALRWDDDPLTRHLRWMSSLDLADLALAMPGHSPLPPHALPRSFAEIIRAPRTGDPLNDIMRLDFATYLPGSVLTKVDRASMAHGLEVRPPLLANAMIDLAFSLPSKLKIHGATTKALLKAAAAAYLPQQIIHRRKKGFAIPLAAWLKAGGPLRDRLDGALGDGPLWYTGILNRAAFIRWREEHDTSRADRSRPLWAAIVLDHWLRRL